MKYSYQKIFEINVVHSYFKYGCCDGIQFRPLPDTMQLFKRFGLLFKSVTNGFGVYTNTSQPVPGLLSHITATTAINSFQFYINCTSSNFLLYTDLPMDWIGQLKYDTHSVKNTGNDGIFQLSQKIFYSNVNSFLGCVNVRLDDLQQWLTQYRTVQLNITYEPRNTFWQYCIINTTNLSFRHLSIAEKEGTRFSNPENVVLENGQSAIALTSLTPIPLCKEPNYQFNLICTTISGIKAVEKIIFKGLPLPDPARFKRVLFRGEQVVLSPIHVYV